MNFCDGSVACGAWESECSASSLISLPGLLQCLPEGFRAAEGVFGFSAEDRRESPEFGARRDRKHQPGRENPKMHDAA